VENSELASKDCHPYFLRISPKLLKEVDLCLGKGKIKREVCPNKGHGIPRRREFPKTFVFTN